MFSRFYLIMACCALLWPAAAYSQTTVLVHVEGYGNLTTVTNSTDSWAGTRGRKRQLEGFQITSDPLVNVQDIQYMAHISKRGDTGWANGGTYVGTRGWKLAMEGFAIRLVGSAAERFDVWYRAHMAKTGDTVWFRNGDFCGQRGLRRPIEAIQVVIRPKANR